MPYELLGKLYYGDQNAYAQAYRARFDSEDAVRLDFSVAGNQAFFVQNTEVLKLAYEIVKLDKVVSVLSSRLPGVAKDQYSKKCLIDEIVLTNKIEGVYSSRKEIDEALDILEKQSDEKGRRHRFVGLVNRYLKLLTGEEIPLGSCQDIRRIYDEVFLEEVVAEEPKHAPDGKIFRKDISAVHSETDRVIHQGLYPESKIIAAMEQALAFLGDDSVDRLCRICIFHYLIEYIHPFYDGNGRLGRFILSYCISETLEPLLSYRISETIKENIKEYYRAFKDCNDPHNLGDLTPFLLMMLRMILAALTELSSSLSRRLKSWGRYETLVSTFPEAEDVNVRNMYSYLIQAALFSEKGISTDELKACFQESYYTVRKLLGSIRPEMLVSGLKGKSKYYQLDLNALDAMLLKIEMDGSPSNA
jgi:Fic family protein